MAFLIAHMTEWALLTELTYTLFLGCLGIAAYKDMKTLRIPNRLVITIAAVWMTWRACLLIQILVNHQPINLWVMGSIEGLASALVVGSGLLIACSLYERLTQRPSLGGGDVKLMAVSTLFLGIERSLISLFIASCVAILLAWALPKCGWRSLESTGSASRQSLSAVPYAPAIAIGAAISLLL